MERPFHLPRCAQWTLGSCLALSLPSAASSRHVDFSIVLPQAENVHLVGSFNDWQVSADSRMENENGVWRKTLSLDDGTYSYNFKTDAAETPGDGFLLDWKSTGETPRKRGRTSSVLVVPDDLDSFSARQRPALLNGSAIEIPLFYDRHSTNDASFRPGGGNYQSLETAPPAGNWILPEFVGEHPLFSLAKLGQTECLVAIARQSPGDPFYNRAYFDRNANRDLTDDPPIDGEAKPYGRENYFSCEFPPLDLEIDAAGHRLPYSFSLRIGGTMPAKDDPAPASTRFRNLHFGVSPNCAYLGEFAIDGNGYRIAIGDSNANGVFGDNALLNENVRYSDRRLVAQGDTLYVSAAGRAENADGLILGQCLAIGERLFDVHLDVPANRLTLTPRQENLGALEFTAPVRSMSLVSASENGTLMLCRVGRRASVPAGSWRLLEYQIAKPDDWGDLWLLQAKGTDKLPSIVVTPGGSVPLPVGEPIQAGVEIYDRALQQAAANGQLRLSLALLGNAGELVSDLRHLSGTQTQHKKSKRNSNRPEEAAYRILKPDGELVFSGSFEYG